MTGSRTSWVRRLGSSSVGGVTEILHEPHGQLRGSLTGHVVYVVGAEFSVLCDRWARTLEGASLASLPPPSAAASAVWTLQRDKHDLRRRGAFTAWVRRDSSRLRGAVTRVTAAIHELEDQGPDGDDAWWEAARLGLIEARDAYAGVVAALDRHTGHRTQRVSRMTLDERKRWADVDRACRDTLARVCQRWEATQIGVPSDPLPVAAELADVWKQPDPDVRLLQALEIPAGDPSWVAWAHQHPREVADLAGAPVAARCLASRQLLPLAVRGEQESLAELAQRWEQHPRAVSGRSWSALSTAWHRDALLSTWMTSPRPTPETAIGHHTVRLRHLESLLHDPVGSSPRQVVTISTEGQGRAIEVFGELNEHTTAVAVLVPGTGTDLRGLHMPSQAAQHLYAHLGPTSAVFAWMDAEFPLAFVNHSPWARFARQAGAALRQFVDGLRVPEGVPITLIGHSYGGSMVGEAERLGVRVQRVIHAASAGAGPGVRGVDDYAQRDRWGQPRHVQRWAVMAPGDPVSYAHRASQGLTSALRVGGSAMQSAVWSGLRPVDLGADPRSLRGVTVLEAGVWIGDSTAQLRADVGPGFGYPVELGSPLRGPAAHNGVLSPLSSVYAQIVKIVGAHPRTPEQPVKSRASTI